MSLLVLQQHALYFTEFMLLATAFCVSELVVVITPFPLSAFNRKNCRAFQISALETQG